MKRQPPLRGVTRRDLFWSFDQQTDAENDRGEDDRSYRISSVNVRPVSDVGEDQKVHRPRMTALCAESNNQPAANRGVLSQTARRNIAANPLQEVAPEAFVHQHCPRETHHGYVVVLAPRPHATESD